MHRREKAMKKMTVLLSVSCFISLLVGACSKNVQDSTKNSLSESNVSETESNSSFIESNSSIESSSSFESNSSAESSSSFESNSSSSEITKTYTITWKNGDEILEVDENVQEGTLPTYDGLEPKKEDANGKGYTFDGWLPEITLVNQDMTYTATFNEYDLPVEINYYFNGLLLKNEMVEVGSTLNYVPEIENYAFTGWYTDADCTQSYELNQPISKAMDLHAKMDPIGTYFEYNDLGEHEIDCKIFKKENGLFIEYIAKEDANLFGYGVCLDLPSEDISILLATTGNIAKQTYQNWAWNYQLPADVGAIVKRDVMGEKTRSSIYFSNETLNISQTTESIGVCFFEVVNANGSQYGIYNCAVYDNTQLVIDGGVDKFPRMTLLTPNTTQDFERFGASQALISLSTYDFGLKITIVSTPTTATFGYGIMIGDFQTNAGICDLYALNFGTMDHHIYGDWAWNGNYVLPSSIGVLSSETNLDGNKIVTLFYTFDTLNSALYGLNLSDDTSKIGVQFFEYVTDAQGNLYGCYNCLNVNNTPLAFDTGVANFVEVELR